jgi:glutamate-1-semialdehyde 2,1-aminomutase
VRAFRGVGGTPIFVERAVGPHFWDVDGNRYIDYVLSWGPLILGHSHPDVIEALVKQIPLGTSYGAPTQLETELAEQVIAMIPSVEQVRFVNSGTEATMSALRLARAYTGRMKIVKFNGCYHGHADMLLVQAGSGVATLGLPDSPGVPAASTSQTLVAEYNDLESVRAIFKDHGEDISAIIVEPVAGNMGFVLPEDGFLQGLRDITSEAGALLIFDEVMTGFRVDPGCAQTVWNVTPDLTCLGKVIGGGLPVGAYGGKREIMQSVAPAGPMYQAGTLSGNPLAMAAGLTTLRKISEAGVFAQAAAHTQQLVDGMKAIAAEKGVPMQIGCKGTMFGAYFLQEAGQRIVSYSTARQYADPPRFAKYFWHMAERGVYLAPSQFEAAFMSTVHTQVEIDETLTAMRESLALV